MSRDVPEVVVAGHICLDIIPTIDVVGGQGRFLCPGTLTNVGPAVISTGGAVSNTGLALHRLGFATRLMGKVGDDLLGRAILDVVRSHDPALAEGMIVAAGEHSSYSIVISAPDVDRCFLHCPGANDTFGAADVAIEKVAEARLFHFGYPPLMRRMYADDGLELSTMLRRVKEAGLTVSLDMTTPDPESAAGRADWPLLLERSLPWVDVFLPSLDEILFMIDRPRFLEICKTPASLEIASPAGLAMLADLSSRLLSLGAPMIVLKLGDQGLYLRTTDDASRLAAMGRCAPADLAPWVGRELLSPCFAVNVAGTTGAGDCAIAGFLGALLRGQSPAGAMTAAVAVGACCVERPDATSGVPSWPSVCRRVEGGWVRRPLRLAAPGWKWREADQVWAGPHDSLKAWKDVIT
jgi:sugar/nucleoside kinase (ribokinase family)